MVDDFIRRNKCLIVEELLVNSFTDVIHPDGVVSALYHDVWLYKLEKAHHHHAHGDHADNSHSKSKNSDQSILILDFHNIAHLKGDRQFGAELSTHSIWALGHTFWALIQDATSGATHHPPPIGGADDLLAQPLELFSKRSLTLPYIFLFGKSSRLRLFQFVFSARPLLGCSYGPTVFVHYSAKLN